MKTFSRVTVLFAAAFSLAANACPEYLNNEMRKLSSKETVNFCDAYAGKAMLIVNTASNCGYTPQFDGLEALHREYESKGLVVLGFSSDDFFQEENDEGDLIVNRRTITTGQTRDKRVAVLSGLEASEKVVSKGLLRLRAGQKVKIQDESQEKQPQEASE